MRTEQDLLGQLEVPAEALYGIHTQRALINFPIMGNRTAGDFSELIEGFILTKKAATITNGLGGFLDDMRVKAIVQAADWVLTEQQFQHFPVHALHGGGGTSLNMNINEVLANYAEELLGGRRGEYLLVNPNEHVNLHQSTSDVNLTAYHVAIIRRWSRVEPNFRRLINTLRFKGMQWYDQKRLARTCLQDAVEITFEDLFGGYAGFLERATDRIAELVDGLHSVNLGGTIVGRKGDVPEGYFERVIAVLCHVTEDTRFNRPNNLFDAAQNVDDLIAVSSALNILARGLIKIAKDLRLLASGPEAGLAEIRLPAVQAGSSMMPGKVNPVIPEFVIQLCLFACGNHAACESTLDHGELDLNIWSSLIIYCILNQMELLSNAVISLESNCVRGLDIDPARNTRHAESVFATLSSLMKTHGYTKINDICKQANNVEELTQLLKENQLI
jgi:aspartate ammonia-lyase